MAHYAFLDANNVVVEVITGRDEDDTTGGITDWEAYYASKREGLSCKRTSYNTYQDIQPIFDNDDFSDLINKKIIGWQDNGSKHILGGVPFRGKYACIGDTYDPVNDVFVAPVVE